MAGHVPPPLRLFVLGGFRAECGGREWPGDIVWGRPNTKALIKYLAVEPTHRLHREQVIEALWPNLPREAALNSFRKACHLARRAFEPELLPREPSTFLHLTEQVVALDRETVRIDVDQFELLAASALQGADVSACERALAIYAGELLPDDRYEEWVATRRAALAERRRQVLVHLAATLERGGAYGPAVERLGQVLHEDPTAESVHRAVMRLHMVMGSRHQALRQYQACREALRRELAADPSPQTEVLYREVLSNNDASAGRARPVSAAGNVVAPALPAAVHRQTRGPLTGRERPLQWLAAEIGRAGVSRPTVAGGSQPHLLLVSGEAGVGKSRLAAEAAVAANRRGWLVLWGGSYEQEGQLLYGPFVEALEGYLAATSNGERRHLAAIAPGVARLLPPVTAEAEPATAAGGTAESERGRLFASFGRLLNTLGETQPVLLILDDLHAADAASLSLLHFLARMPPGLPWLLLGAYREEEVGRGAFRRLLAALSQEHLSAHAEILRLARPDCDCLVQSLLPGGVVEAALSDAIYDHSLGNPFFVTQLVGDLQERGRLALVDGRWQAPEEHLAVPRQVGDLVTMRVDRLGEEVGRTLTLAAVAGMESSFAELSAAAAALSPPLAGPALLGALERALEARLLVEHGRGYRFRHPLIRAALYEGLSDRRRTQLHTALAAALEQHRPDDVEALAFQWGKSEHTDQGIQYLERAGDRALLLYANETAEAHYRELVERLDQLGRSVASAAARAKLSHALTVQGRYDAALDLLEWAAGIFRETGDGEGLARTLAQIGRVHASRGTPDQGLARIEALRGSLTGNMSAGVALLEVARAHLLFGRGRYTEQLASAARAAELARAVGDQRTQVEADMLRGLALCLLVRRQEGRAVLERVIPRAEAVGDLSTMQRALNGMAAVYELDGELQTCRIYRERGLHVAERMGDPARIAFAASNLGGVLHTLGDWKPARAQSERAIAIFQSLGPSSLAAYAHIGLGSLDAEEGKWLEARRRLEEGRAIAGRAGDLQALRFVAVALGRLELLCGRADAALADLGPLLERADDEEFVPPLLVVAARAHLKLGDTTWAERAVARAVQLSLAHGSRAHLCEAYSVQAMVLTEQRRWVEAESCCDAAVALARRLPYPYGEAQTLHRRGSMLVLRRETERARHCYEEARRLFRKLGASPDAERAEQALAGL